MSVQAISAAFAIQGVSPSEKLVLLALANFADADRRCYPSQVRLALDTGLTDRTIRTVILALEERGLVTRQERRRPNGSRSTDVITLHLAPQPETVSVCNQPEIDDRTNRKLTAKQPETVSPPTTFEPSLEEPSLEEPLRRARAPARPKPKASRRCPSDWMPDPAFAEWAQTEGFTAGELERELSKMKDHEFRSPRFDWTAVARNWIRQAAETHRTAKDVRPLPSAKLAARQANHERALRGFEIAAGGRG